MATYSVQFGIERVQNIEIERNQSSLCSVAIEEEKDISYIFVYECVCTHIQLHTYIMYSIYVYWFTHGHCGHWCNDTHGKCTFLRIGIYSTYHASSYYTYSTLYRCLRAQRAAYVQYSILPIVGQVRSSCNLMMSHK